MRKPTTFAFATLLMGALLVPPMASAVHDQGSSFTVGSRFNIGGLAVALVISDRSPRYPYYRFPRRIAYRGYHCTDRCFVRGGHYYHARSCPVANIYFRNHHFAPSHFWARSAPRVHYPRYYSRPPARHWVPPGHRKHGRHWVPPGHRKHGKYKVPPGHRKHRGKGHDKHDRRRGGHWEWDDGRWKWDD